MQVSFVPANKFSANYAILRLERSSPTSGELTHTNADDPHYRYSFRVQGTAEELDALAALCQSVTAPENL